MIVARVEELNEQYQIYVIDSLRESVRLGAGLDEKKILDTPSQTRALAALERFGERLRSFDTHNVRAVATNAVRIARNGESFVRKAEKALGFKIDVISGIEEARLVYCGVAHQLPSGQGRRLVVDIGGGSTEFIIGQDYKPVAMESLYVGCVSTAQQYFNDGTITAKNMREAILNTRKEVATLRHQLRSLGWKNAFGSSGTARALAEICVQNGFTEHGISAQALEKIRKHIVEAGHLDRITLLGLKTDRLPMMPGGLAVMCGVFEELEIEQMEVTEGALRQGLLYDLLGRQYQQDMRETTVAQFLNRYKIDKTHARQVRKVASLLFSQICENNKALQEQLPLLQWAASLHEIGLSISHNSHHKHAAYILSNADMPGFSKREQAILSTWVLAHNGKLNNVANLALGQYAWPAPMCLRLACLFMRRREVQAMPAVQLKRSSKTLEITVPAAWLQAHPLTQYALEMEVDQWSKIGLNLLLKII